MTRWTPEALEAHLDARQRALVAEGHTRLHVDITLIGAKAAEASHADLQEYLGWCLQVPGNEELPQLDISSLQVVDVQIQRRV